MVTEKCHVSKQCIGGYVLAGVTKMSTIYSRSTIYFVSNRRRPFPSWKFNETAFERKANAICTSRAKIVQA